MILCCWRMSLEETLFSINSTTSFICVCFFPPRQNLILQINFYASVSPVGQRTTRSAHRELFCDQYNKDKLEEEKLFLIQVCSILDLKIMWANIIHNHCNNDSHTKFAIRILLILECPISSILIIQDVIWSITVLVCIVYWNYINQLRFEYIVIFPRIKCNNN